MDPDSVYNIFERSNLRALATLNLFPFFVSLLGGSGWVYTSFYLILGFFPQKETYGGGILNLWPCVAHAVQ